MYVRVRYAVLVPCLLFGLFFVPGCPDPKCSLTVTIAPEKARLAGAQWVLGGGQWRNSGETASDLLPGNYTVQCSDLNAWVAPQPVEVALTAGENREMTVTYTQQAFAPDGRMILSYGTGDWANAIIETTDGGLVVAGAASVDTNNRDLLVAKLTAEGVLVWDRLIGGEDHDEAKDVIQTSDGGYLLAGQWTDASNLDACLVKLDANGNEVWAYQYGSPAVTDLEIAEAVVEVADGYVFAGFTSSSGSGDVYLVKVDLNGAVQWTRAFGVDHNGDSAFDLLTTADDGFILAGDTQPALEDLRDFLLVKTDASGTVVWSERYGSPGEAPDQETTQAAFAVAPVNGGYALAGYTRQYQPTDGMPFVGYLVTTNASGTALSTVDYFDEAPNQLFAVDATSDGGLICAGWGNSPGVIAGVPVEHEDFLLLKTTAQGAKTWVKRIGNEDVSWERANAVIELSTGGYVMAGYTTMGEETTGFDVLVVRTDPTGNVG